MLLTGQGDGPVRSSPLGMINGDRSYEAVVELELRGTVQAGLLLFYNTELFCGIASDGKQLHNYKLGKELRYGTSPVLASKHLYMRVENIANVATFFFSDDGSKWQKTNS
jgi:xylan 1,4-beta-xylosidase